MKKLIVPLLLLSLTLVSCGSSNEPIKPESTKINGILGNDYEVVDKDYKMINAGSANSLDIAAKRTGIYKVLPITIRRTSATLPFDPNKTTPYGTSETGKNTYIGVGIELFDKDGNSIQTVNASTIGFAGNFNSDDIKSVINLQNGETATVRWIVDDNVVSKVKSFKVTSAMETDNTDDDNTSTISDETTDDVSMDTDNQDWNKFLDDYEALINQYIVLLKKAKDGDVSAMQEYPPLLEKAQKISDDLDNNKSDLSATQLKRLIDLESKMAKAAIDLMQ